MCTFGKNQILGTFNAHLPPTIEARSCVKCNKPVWLYIQIVLLQFFPQFIFNLTQICRCVHCAQRPSTSSPYFPTHPSYKHTHSLTLDTYPTVFVMFLSFRAAQSCQNKAPAEAVCIVSGWGVFECACVCVYGGAGIIYTNWLGPD